LTVSQHPLLKAETFRCDFPQPLGELTTPPALLELLALRGNPPVQSSDSVRERVRALLRHGGFKPSGRSKPASEYLLKAHSGGGIGSINLAVDACNAVSAASGLPISVVDAELAEPPYHIAVAPKESYVFNPTGQELDLEGLLCLYDKHGPCGSPVKDSQRTKTHPGTRRTLCVVWGEQSLAEHVERTTRWYRELLEGLGASTGVI